MKRFAAILALVLLLPGLVYGASKLSIGSVDVSLNTKTFDLQYGGTLAVAASATDVTAGLNGVMAVPVVAAAPLNVTSGFRPPNAPYGCKLNVIMKDTNNNGTVTCSNVTICGVDQFDRSIGTIRTGATANTTFATIGCENVGTVAEGTEVQTISVFRRISQITTSACSGGDATDVLRVSCSGYIGLPHYVSDSDAILAIGIEQAALNQQMNWYAGSATTVYDIPRSAVRLYNAAGTADISGAPASTQGARISFLVRGRAGF